MNAGPDVERLLSDWLDGEAPARAPDRILLTASDRLDHTRQWRFGVAWRFIPMNGNVLRVAAAAVIGVLLLGGGIYIVGGGVPNIGGRPTPSPSPTVAPSGAIKAVPPDYTTRPGWILLEHLGANAPDGSGPASGPDGRSLWLIRSDGSQLQELAPGLPADGKIEPDWSPDGSHIVFGTVGPEEVIYETDLDGAASLVASAQCADAGRPTPCIERSPAYSPDGTNLAFIGSYDDTNVVRIRQRLNGASGPFHQTAAYLESTRVPSKAAWNSGPSWSPDGKQLVFYRVAKDADGKPTGASDLWIVDATFPIDSPEVRKIPLPAGMTAGDPDWSPDGSLIVFSSEPIHDWNDAGVDDHPDVYTVRPDGSELKRLTYDGGSGSPSWTSDGKILFYSQRAMWLMDADGKHAAPVYPDGPTLWGKETGWSYYGYWQPQP